MFDLQKFNKKTSSITNILNTKWVALFSLLNSKKLKKLLIFLYFYICNRIKFVEYMSRMKISNDLIDQL